MMYFQINPLDNIITDSRAALALAEVHAYFSGQFQWEDVPFDQETVTSSYLESLPDDEQMEIGDEPQNVFQFALEKQVGIILAAARNHRKMLGEDYPFEIEPEDGVILRRKTAPPTTVYGNCYIVLQIYTLSVEGIIQFYKIADNDPADADFRRLFDDIFEVISGIAVANNQRGSVFLNGSERSSEKLLLRLNKYTKILNAGVVKNFADLNADERNANDGGIDALVVTHSNRIPHELYLVGATVQKSSVEQKIVGMDRITRFSDFFTTRIAPARGAFVHHMPHIGAYRLKCSRMQCAYYYYENIIENIVPSEDTMTNTIRRHTMRLARHTARKYLSIISGSVSYRTNFSTISMAT